MNIALLPGIFFPQPGGAQVQTHNLANKLVRKGHKVDVLILNKTNKINNLIPSCSIGADVIVGFPSETDKNFTDTYNLIRENKISYLQKKCFCREKYFQKITQTDPKMKENRCNQYLQPFIKKTGNLIILYRCHKNLKDLIFKIFKILKILQETLLHTSHCTDADCRNINRVLM